MTVIGLMSGTSVDGIDTIAVHFTRTPDNPGTLHGTLLYTGEAAWAPEVRARLLDALPPAQAGVGEIAALNSLVGEAFGQAAVAVQRDLAAVGQRVDLVVSHGQTMFHGARADGTVETTLQIGDPSRIAAATGCPVVHDLRSADVAAGGQGAPLVPILDSLLVAGLSGSGADGEIEGGAGSTGSTALLNIGGIANVTVVGADGRIAAIGDTGPGNALLDAAVREATGEPCDRDAAIARTGQITPELLAALLADPLYTLPLPRSTGREYFDARYVQRMADAHAVPLPPLPDLLATLVELTAVSIARALDPQAAPDYPATAPTLSGPQPAVPDRLLVSGGGLRNPLLMERIAAHLPHTQIGSADHLGVPSDAKEALLVALLGWLSVQGLPGVPLTQEGAPATGAHTAQVLGSLTPPVALLQPDGLGAVHRLVLHSADAEAPERAPSAVAGTETQSETDPAQARSAPPVAGTGDTGETAPVPSAPSAPNHSAPAPPPPSAPTTSPHTVQETR